VEISVVEGFVIIDCHFDTIPALGRQRDRHADNS